MKRFRPAIVSAIVSLIIGAASGYGIGRERSERDLEAMAFVRAVGTIGTSSATLRIADQNRMDKIVRFHEPLLRAGVSDAMRYSDHLPNAANISHIERSLARAEDDAIHRGWRDVATQIASIRQRLKTE